MIVLYCGMSRGNDSAHTLEVGVELAGRINACESMARIVGVMLFDRWLLQCCCISDIIKGDLFHGLQKANMLPASDCIALLLLLSVTSPPFHHHYHHLLPAHHSACLMIAVAQ